ncbi:NUDIX domain-containing protein [Roseixanthobacter glucoisosaccharinicivorans]|uniref:NUDIX domain-containing protein n=1 Tax=Roseixanthobacter glucoisosaccharinicivorans TaxID=3119923 RepID=UPI003728E00C
MPITTDKPSLRRLQYAALPYRQRQDGEVQIRLITSRETRRWVVPKGWPIKGLTPPQTAAREAYEEAGLMGTMSHAAAGLYSYEKRLSPTRSVPCDVMVFPMKVKRYVKKWPERLERVGFWFSADSAAAAVQEEGLAQIILQFAAVLTARHAAKVAAQEEERATHAAAKLKAAKPKAAAKGKAAAEIEPAAPLAEHAAGKPAGKKADTKKADTKKAETKKAEAKKVEAKKAEPEKAETKKADAKKAEAKVSPKKAAGKKAPTKKAAAENAPSPTMRLASPMAGKGSSSDEEGGAGPSGAVGGISGKAIANTSPAKISPAKTSPAKTSPSKKPTPGKSPSKKQPAKTRNGQAPGSGTSGAGSERMAAIGAGAGFALVPVRASLAAADGAMPAVLKKAERKKAIAKKAEPKKSEPKKSEPKKADLKKASAKATAEEKLGKKADIKKAGTKKAGRKPGAVEATGAVSTDNPARRSQRLASDL